MSLSVSGDIYVIIIPIISECFLDDATAQLFLPLLLTLIHFKSIYFGEFQVVALLFTDLFLIPFVMDMIAFGDCSFNVT